MTGMAREGAMAGAMAGAKANGDEVSDSMAIIDAQIRRGVLKRTLSD